MVLTDTYDSGREERMGGPSFRKDKPMMASKEVRATAKRLPPNAGKGRVKGTPNKTTKALKEMIPGSLGDLVVKNTWYAWQKRSRWPL